MVDITITNLHGKVMDIRHAPSGGVQLVHVMEPRRHGEYLRFSYDMSGLNSDDRFMSQVPASVIAQMVRVNEELNQAWQAQSHAYFEVAFGGKGNGKSSESTPVSAALKNFREDIAKEEAHRVQDFPRKHVLQIPRHLIRDERHDRTGRPERATGGQSDGRQLRPQELLHGRQRDTPTGSGFAMDDLFQARKPDLPRPPDSGLQARDGWLR